MAVSYVKQCSMVAVIIFISLPGIFGRSRWDSLFNKPQDCTFTPYGSWNSCYKRSDGTYEHTRRRQMFQPKNNGKPCPKNPALVERKACSKTEAMADEFLRQVHSPGKIEAQQHFVCPFAKCSRPDPRERECRTWRDKDNNIIMGGGNCDDKKQQKRSVSNDFGTVLKRIRRQSVPVTERHRDILFLLDESGSVGSKDFEIVKGMAAAITDSLCDRAIVSPGNTRISVLSFDNKNHAHIYLKKEHMSQGWKLAEKIRKIPYNSRTAGKTCLSSALKATKTEIFTKERGARLDRKIAEQMIILITDGCANCATSSLQSISQDLYQNYISILAIFIGPPSSTCREQLMKLNMDERCWELFGLDSWKEAEEFKEFIEEKQCFIIWQGLGKSC